MPEKPTDVPVSDASFTSDKVIRVTFAAVDPDDNGSAILSYELAMDDGQSNNYVSLVGFDSDNLQKTFTVREGVVKGREHRFKYRVKNAVGWGPYSDVSSILAATTPDAALEPYFVSFAADTLSIAVPRSLNNRGSPILGYEVWVDEGDDFYSDFRKLAELAVTTNVL